MKHEKFDLNPPLDSALGIVSPTSAHLLMCNDQELDLIKLSLDSYHDKYVEDLASQSVAVKKEARVLEEMCRELGISGYES